MVSCCNSRGYGSAAKQEVEPTQKQKVTTIVTTVGI